MNGIGRGKTARTQYLLASAAVGRGWSGYIVTLCNGFNATVPTNLYDIPYNCVDAADLSTVRVWGLHAWVSPAHARF